MSRLHGGSGAQGLFGSWLASPPPDAAIEIAPEAVSIAAVSGGSQPAVEGYAVQPLPPGAVVPSLTAQNVIDHGAVVTAVRSAIERLGMRPRRVALVLPDLAARVAIIRFDHVPAKRDDLDQLIRWQVRKAAPFAMDDAALTYSPGARAGAAGDFVVVVARRATVREYEAVCEEADMHAGLVDLATLSVVNLYLAGPAAPSGDSLIVHMRPEATSIVIMRGGDVIFYRNRAEGDEDALADVVHQTTMYYQDRLSGQGFTRVLLGGAGRTIGAAAAARQSLEDRLATAVEPIDPTSAVTLGNRVHATPELTAALAPLMGILLRTRRETVGA
jgi:Tfp pilus assembly PilM family ATPase